MQDTDLQFISLVFNNPNADNPHARLLLAILGNAIQDAVASQSTERNRRQAWYWLENDDVLINYCLSLIDIDRDRMINHLKKMQINKINLKTMYQQKERLYD